MSHGYESGRLDLPFVGHCTFGKRPIATDWDKIDADVAVIGIPYDMGTQYRSGARFGPRAIREASTLFSFGHGGAYGTPGFPRHHFDREYVGPQGPPTAQVAYPYYTIRGPRDFLLDNPPSIGR